eukprot:gene14476-biopygen2081
MLLALGATKTSPIGTLELFELGGGAGPRRIPGIARSQCSLIGQDVTQRTEGKEIILGILNPRHLGCAFRDPVFCTHPPKYPIKSCVIDEIGFDSFRQPVLSRAPDLADRPGRENLTDVFRGAAPVCRVLCTSAITSPAP